MEYPTYITGIYKEVKGLAVVDINPFGSGILSAVFEAVDGSIQKIVPQADGITSYDVLEALMENRGFAKIGAPTKKTD